jgi:K+-transporting ATPase KdpF subunit
MSALYAIALLVALALGVYLVWALFRPEDFS